MWARVLVRSGPPVCHQLWSVSSGTQLASGPRLDRPAGSGWFTVHQVPLWSFQIRAPTPNVWASCWAEAMIFIQASPSPRLHPPLEIQCQAWTVNKRETYTVMLIGFQSSHYPGPTGCHLSGLPIKFKFFDKWNNICVTEYIPHRNINIPFGIFYSFTFLGAIWRKKTF